MTVRGAFLQQLLGDIVPPTSARRLSGGVQGNTQGLPALDQEALSAVNLVAGAGFVPDSERRRLIVANWIYVSASHGMNKMQYVGP